MLSYWFIFVAKDPKVSNGDVTPWRFRQRMPTYEKFGIYVAARWISYVYVLYKLTASWSTLVYVVLRQSRRKI